MGDGLFKKHVIDRYFLEKACPYTKRRLFRMNSVYWLGAISLILFIGIVMFSGSPPKTVSGQGLEYNTNGAPSNTSNGPQNGNSKSSPPNSFWANGLFSGGLLSSGGTSTRHSANQVIRRGENGTDPTGRLPMGYGIPVRLVNAILSTNNQSPVVAEVTTEIAKDGSDSIPAGTHAIGHASFDDKSNRVQIQFTTFVYPEGDEHSLQGMAVMPDGSAGVAGDYHSGRGTRQLGRFLGNFVGGLASGMKDRTSGGLAGIPYDEGSVKNGILNGISLSAEDESKTFSEDLKNVQGYMTVSQGVSFTIFLEKEYQP
jgi:hypothetical protein